MNIFGLFILFLETFAVPVFHKNELITGVSRSANQIRRNPRAKYLRRNHHHRFGYGVSITDNRRKFQTCMLMLAKKLREKKLQGLKVKVTSKNETITCLLPNLPLYFLHSVNLCHCN